MTDGEEEEKDMCELKVDGTDRILCPQAGFCINATETLNYFSIFPGIFLSKMRHSDLLSTADLLLITLYFQLNFSFLFETHFTTRIATISSSCLSVCPHEKHCSHGKVANFNFADF